MDADEARMEVVERLRAKTKEMKLAASDKDAARLRALDRLKARTMEEERAKAQLAEQEALAAEAAKAAAEKAAAEAQAHDAEASRMREQAVQQRLRAKREEALIEQIGRLREEVEEASRKKAAAANARMEAARQRVEEQQRHDAEQDEKRRRHNELAERSRVEERRHREEEQRFRDELKARLHEELEARLHEERQRRRHEEERLRAKEDEKNARLRAKDAEERARSRSARASRAQKRAVEGRVVLRARSKSVKTHRQKAADLQAEVVALREKMRERDDKREIRHAERLRAKDMCTTFVDIDSSDDEAFDAWEAVSADVKGLEIRYLEAADIAREFQDSQDSGYEGRMAKLLADPKRFSDSTWADARRHLYGERARALQARRVGQTEADLAHAKAVRAAMANVVAASSQGDKAADSVELSEFTQKALERLRAKEEEEVEDARAAAASSQGDAGRHDAKFKYDSFFLEGFRQNSGRGKSRRVVA